MLRSLHTITIISDYLRSKNKLKPEASSIDDIYNFFIYLQNNQNKFYTLYIYNYLFNFISSDEVAKHRLNRAMFWAFVVADLENLFKHFDKHFKELA